MARFYRQLQHDRRVQPSFHVTLIHRANSATHPEAWHKYATLLSQAGAADGSGAEANLGECRVQLERVIWDERVMCVVARLPDAQEKGFHTTNQVAHVTVGTARQDIKPKESNDLLAAWLERGSGEGSGIGELQIEHNVMLDGTVVAVMQRRGCKGGDAEAVMLVAGQGDAEDELDKRCSRATTPCYSDR